MAVDAKIVQVDPSALEIGRNRGVALGMVGDVISVLDQMTKEAASLHGKTSRGWMNCALRAMRSWYGRRIWLAPKPRCMPCLFTKPSSLCCVLTTASSLMVETFAISVVLYCLPSSLKRWFYVSSLGMLGSSLPTALAAKVAYPDSRVIMLTGDGAFGFNGMEFDTAVRHRLNIVAILGNDSAWGIDRQIQLRLIWPARGYRVAADALRTGRSRPRWVRGVCGTR